jgi:hypothetical protein
LISELRLTGASTCEQANEVLDRFVADFNQHFAVASCQAASDFRRLPRSFDLARCLSFRYQRTVAPDHTIAFGSERIQLPPPASATPAAWSSSLINSMARSPSISDRKLCTPSNVPCANSPNPNPPSALPLRKDLRRFGFAFLQWPPRPRHYPVNPYQR